MIDTKNKVNMTNPIITNDNFRLKYEWNLVIVVIFIFESPNLD